MQSSAFTAILRACFPADAEVTDWHARPAEFMVDHTLPPWEQQKFYDLTIKCRSSGHLALPDIFQHKDICAATVKGVKMIHVPVWHRESVPWNQDVLATLCEHNVECETEYVVRIRDVEVFCDYLDKVTAQTRYDRQFDQDVDSVISK